jgi:hypothetical protein
MASSASAAGEAKHVPRWSASLDMTRDNMDILKARTVGNPSASAGEEIDVSQLLMQVNIGPRGYDLRVRSLPMNVLTVLAMPAVTRKLTDSGLLKLVMMYCTRWNTQCPKTERCNEIVSSTARHVEDRVRKDKPLTFPAKVTREMVETALNKQNTAYCKPIIELFLDAYYRYTTGQPMTNAIIQRCTFLSPHIQDIGYVAFGHLVVLGIQKRHEYWHAKDPAYLCQQMLDNRVIASEMKHILDNILDRVDRINLFLHHRGLTEVTYMDSCRVTCAMLHVWFNRWVSSGFTSLYPTKYKLRTTDIDGQMVRFHRAVFAGAQFEHLQEDIYDVATEHLATSVVYFNFCSIGGIDNLIEFAVWYRAALAAYENDNSCMPMISFTKRGITDDVDRCLCMDGLMRLCAMRSKFLTYEPVHVFPPDAAMIAAMESEEYDEPMPVKKAKKVSAPKSANDVRKLNRVYDLHCTQARKALKAKALNEKVLKAKAARKAKLQATDE